MNIDDLTIKQARELASMFGGGARDIAADSPYTIKQAYLIRTVTYHVSGIVEQVTPHEIVLTDAAWIADSGRFAEAIKSGKFAEVEAVPGIRVIVGRGAVIDAWPIPTAPTVTK